MSNLSQREDQERNLSLVIPVTDIKGEKNANQLTNLLKSIEDGNIHNNANILVCFDSCGEFFVSHFIEKFPFIQSIWNKGNRLNFARNSNNGLKMAHSLNTHALLVNQDCMLPAYDHLKKIAGEGIACATSIPFYEGLDLNKSQAPEHKRIPTKEKFPFYCVFINRDVMSAIGYLDGIFTSGSFEDDDYITRALLKGLTCEKTNVIIYHEGTHIDTTGQWESASGSYTSKNLSDNMMKYGTKWQIPGSIPHEKMIEWVLENHVSSEEMAIR